MKKFFTKILTVFLFVAIIISCLMGSGCNGKKSVSDALGIPQNFIKFSNWKSNVGDLKNLIWVEGDNEKIFCKFLSRRGKLFSEEADLVNGEYLLSPNEKVRYADVFWGSGRDYVRVLLIKNSQVVGYAFIVITMYEDGEIVPWVFAEKLLQTPISEAEAEAQIAIMENEEKEEYNKKDKFVGLFIWQFTSSMINNIIEVDYDDEDVVCKYTCKNGKIHAPDNQLVNEAEGKVYQEVFYVDGQTGEFEEDCVTILLIKNSQVIGYAAIKIDKVSALNYQPTIVVEKLLQTPISEAEAYEKINEIIQ